MTKLPRLRPSVPVIALIVGCLLVLTSAAAIGFLAVALNGSNSALSAVTSKSQEQTKAEVQLRKVVASQQTTIAKQGATIQVFTSAASATVVSGQRRLIANFDALDLVIIDAVQGNKIALQRDLRLLQNILLAVP